MDFGGQSSGSASSPNRLLCFQLSQIAPFLQLTSKAIWTHLSLLKKHSVSSSLPEINSWFSTWTEQSSYSSCPPHLLFLSSLHLNSDELCHFSMNNMVFYNSVPLYMLFLPLEMCFQLKDVYLTLRTKVRSHCH